MILLDDYRSLAAHYGPRRASLKSAVLTPKNRVWKNFGTPSGRMSWTASQVIETTSGSITYSYNIASGRPEWLSRDPIAENGGINLYAYVNGDPINYVDPDGLNAVAGGALINSAAGAALGGTAGAISGAIGGGLFSDSPTLGGFIGDVAKGALSGGVGGAVGGGIAGVAPVPGLSTSGGAIGSTTSSALNSGLNGKKPCEKTLAYSAVVGALFGAVGELAPGFRPIAVGIGAGLTDGITGTLMDALDKTEGQNLHQKKLEELGLE